ncbi:MAG: MASE3 domain-containing protein [Candidatus Paceibacterota bacterium]|jgi:signal transduction histidine kinase
MFRFLKTYGTYLQLLLILALVYSLHLYNYLLFHSFAELLSIVVAFTIFIVAWNSRNYLDNKTLFFVAMAMLPLAVIDSLHTFAFKGVFIFENITANMPTQLWLIGRYFFSIALLAAPFVADKIKKKEFILYGMIGILAAILLLFFTFHLFPDAYIEGRGLTSFKIYSEYVIILMMGGALYGFYTKRDRLDREVYRYIVFAIVSAIISEFMFTLYFAVTDEFNLLGHIFKIITFFFLYAGLIEINMMEPYRLMFKNLNDLNIAKSEFLSLASHQLKNPLSVILLSADMMKTDVSFSTSFPLYHRYTDDISHAVFRMKKIIDTLLNVTKIELGIAEVKEESVDPTVLIQETITELERIAKERNVSITNRVEGMILPCIKSDQQLLSIVFENILSNAIKYSRPNSNVEITAIAKPTLTIIVRDSGYGIPDKQQSQILKSNFRGDNVTSLIKDGSGMGLYMTKKIADKINVGISFESKENEGTVFRLLFA